MCHAFNLSTQPLNLLPKKNPPSHAQQQSETQLRIGIFAQMTDCGDTLDILIAIT